MNGFHINVNVWIHGNNRTYKAKTIHSNCEKADKQRWIVLLQPCQGQMRPAYKHMPFIMFSCILTSKDQHVCARCLRPLHVCVSWHNNSGRFPRRVAQQRPPRAELRSGLEHRDNFGSGALILLANTRGNLVGIDTVASWNTSNSDVFEF